MMLIAQEEKKVIAITDIEHKGLTEFALQRIYNRLETELYNLDKYSVTTRGEIDKILKEQKFQNSGCTQQECAAEIGQLLNAQFMLLPNILFEKNTGNLSVTFKLVNVESAKISSVVTRDFTVKDINDFSRKIFPMLADLYKKETGEDPSIQIGRKSDLRKFEIVFKLNVNDVYCRYDQYAPMTSNGNRAIYKLPEGEYTFYFQKNQYKGVEKTLYLEKDQELDIILEEDRKEIVEYLAPGIIIINTEPEGCEIIISGQKVGTSPYTNVLNPGIHNIELRKDLYHTSILSFSLDPGETEEIVQKLDPKFGSVNIQVVTPLNTTPTPGESIVKIDGKVYYDHKNIQLNTGRHSLIVEKNLYHTFEQSFEINDGDELSLNALLKPAFGRMFIESYPEPNANIFIDGKPVGKTPYTFDPCPTGSYEIRVEKDYFNTAVEVVEVTDESNIKRTILLNSNVGTLSVNAPSADIYINDQFVGHNEFINKYPPGNYVIRAEKKNHYADEQEKFIIVGESYIVDLSPIPKKGSISVILDPPDAKDINIFVDGVKQGKGQRVMTLSVGQHNIEITSKNFLSQTKMEMVEENKNKVIKFELLTYAGSIQQEKDKWERRGKLSGVSFIINSIAIGYFQYKAEKAYGNYQDATNTRSAVDNKNAVRSNELYSMVAMGLGGISLLGNIFTFIKRAKVRS